MHIYNTIRFLHFETKLLSFLYRKVSFPLSGFFPNVHWSCSCDRKSISLSWWLQMFLCRTLFSKLLWCADTLSPPSITPCCLSLFSRTPPSLHNSLPLISLHPAGENWPRKKWKGFFKRKSSVMKTYYCIPACGGATQSCLVRLDGGGVGGFFLPPPPVLFLSFPHLYLFSFSQYHHSFFWFSSGLISFFSLSHFDSSSSVFFCREQHA